MASSTLLRLLNPRHTQIFPHCDIDMWGHVWMSRFRGAWQCLNFDKEYLFGFETLVFATSGILSMHKQRVTAPKRMENLKKHHMTPLMLYSIPRHFDILLCFQLCGISLGKIFFYFSMTVPLCTKQVHPRLTAQSPYIKTIEDRELGLFIQHQFCTWPHKRFTG